MRSASSYADGVGTAPPELQRILQMLHGVVAQAGWLAAPGAGRPAAAAMPSDSKPARH